MIERKRFGGFIYREIDTERQRDRQKEKEGKRGRERRAKKVYSSSWARN